MKQREAQQWEKDWVRTEFEGAVARNATANQIDSLRRELAELLELSYAQVKAIGAWKRRPDQEKLVLEPTNIAQMSDGQAAVVEGHAEESPIVVEEFKGHLANESPRARTRTGDHMNYDFETKNRWREAWGNYLLERMTETERKSARVLCLPGASGLEADLYLRLGFRADNLFCVEGGDNEARTIFIEQMKARGIEPHTGRLKDVVTNQDGPFDVVSLDILGSHSKELIESVTDIATSMRAFVLVNWMAAREGKFNQTSLKMLRTRLNTKGAFESLKEALDADPDSDPLIQNASLEEARDLVGYNTMRKIGEGIDGNWMYREKILSLDLHPDILAWKTASDLPERKKQMAAIHLTFTHCLRMLMETSCGVVGDFSSNKATLVAVMLHNIGSQAVCGSLLVSDLQRMQYRSEGKSRRTYLSDFGTVHRPLREYGELKHSARFVVDCVADLAKYRENSGQLLVRDKHGGLPPTEGGFPRSHFICYENSGSGLSMQLQFAKLHNDAERLRALESKYKSVDSIIETLSEKERTLIE